jgi:hypothetical protein
MNTVEVTGGLSTIEDNHTIKTPGKQQIMLEIPLRRIFT